MKKIILVIYIILFFHLCISAQKEVLQIFDGTTYSPTLWEEIEGFSFDEEENLLQINLNGKDFIEIEVDESNLFTSGFSIPHIDIITDEYLEEIPNKIDYKSGILKLQGFGVYEDCEINIDIRGRGNSSWGFEKKPYRFKFDKKVSLCGLPKAKSYVLLANYTDCSLIQNALAFKIGQMLDLPYTNRCVPVDISLNGKYKGSYLLTNKPGINAGSVDIDEDNSIMWELDVSYDEEYKFRSPILNLPVMVSDPDISEDEFEFWKKDFIELEKASVNHKASSFVDMDILARYVLVYEIMKNDEIGWPKSVKLFKTGEGKYIFGPIWDFDNAMGKVWLGSGYDISTINDAVWKNKLLTYLEEDPLYQKNIKNSWIDFKNSLPELLEFIDSYSLLIKNSAKRNQRRWIELEDFDTSVENLKKWLILRFDALNKIYGN